MFVETIQWSIIAWLVLCFGLIHFSSGQVRSAFRCKNGAEILIGNFCNGVQKCDGSDETPGNASCPLRNFPAVSCTVPPRNFTCQIDRQYICNASITCPGITPCDLGCPGYYRCSKTNQCVLRSTLCDGDPCNGCPEDDDDWPTGIGFQCVRNGRFCRLPQQLLWDSVQDCADAADICYKSAFKNDGRDLRKLPGTVFDDQKCFWCLDGSMMVPRHKVCDGTIDCSDMSDECLCERQLADICNKVQTSHGTCSLGLVDCSTANVTTCVNRTWICDGVVDCPLNLDEKFSYCRGTLQCNKGLPDDALTECRCLNVQRECRYKEPNWPKATTAVLCNGVDECPLAPGAGWVDPPGFPTDECVATCPNRTFGCTVPYKTGISVAPPFSNVCPFNRSVHTELVNLNNQNVCDGIMDCIPSGFDERFCPNRFSCKSGKYVSILRTQICDGAKDCDNGEDELRQNCTKRFYCPSLNATRVSVPKTSLCNQIIDCDNSADESNCTTDGRFYCESGKPLFVLKNQIRDGRGDCSDWSDECSFKFQTSANVLSSRYELISNVFLRAIVWIMATFALLGNAIVLVGETQKLRKVLKCGGSASLRTNHMLVMNLAVADFLMAIYLLMLGISAAAYSGRYCSQSLNWLTSQTCLAMGVLVVLSSEASMLTMVLLTISRLYAISNPVRAISSPRKHSVMFALFLIWGISLTLALVPLISYHQSTFTESALIESNPLFGNVVVSFDAAKNMTLKLLTYSKYFTSFPASTAGQVRAMTSWDQLQQFISAHAPGESYLKIKSYFGYYSASSVCIPNLFVMRNNGAWQFSIAISIINFLGFIFVAAGYILIILKTRESVGKSQSNQSDKKSSAIQRKIVRLIATDFCCWIPLSIMVFVNFSGVKIDSISYAVAAIVLLPINSALNPILYSNFTDKVIDKIRQRHKKAFESRATSSQATGITHHDNTHHEIAHHEQTHPGKINSDNTDHSKNRHGSTHL